MCAECISSGYKEFKVGPIFDCKNSCSHKKLMQKPPLKCAYKDVECGRNRTFIDYFLESD